MSKTETTKMQIELPKQTHAELKKEAIDAESTLHDFTVRVLENAIRKHQEVIKK